jgi:hypothetical protein
LQNVRTRADDVANWPNPFQGIQSHIFQDTNATWLELIDGSSNQENIPYGPLLVKARNLDVVVTLEGSADDPLNNWPKYVFGIVDLRIVLTFKKWNQFNFYFRATKKIFINNTQTVPTYSCYT